MDIVAVPSLSENCGGAVEPLLMKVPVVASKIGGLTDIVIENQTGWLCAPADTASLNSSLQLALNTPEPKRNDMGELGHKLVSELFNPEVNGEKLLAIYKKTLSPFNKVDL
jgi:glycosyltransferase involved in cell wall biosynthesis